MMIRVDSRRRVAAMGRQRQEVDGIPTGLVAFGLDGALCAVSHS